ncbi:hypothetical protein [Flavobacterium cyclinae]|uniref:hypothetical protein n=1 Tax=Flavobacterium cyclinae TaxID=2895947 RepID=UPI001E4055D0|nr:hypothetical protein [Flavobacterium cyclinae]UGS20013.1 hypothetical protein LOS86_08245 [Flavobacterium cyclinae]
MGKIDIEKEKVTTGFKIPEHYFEQFEAKMMEKIPVQKEVKVVSLFYKKQVWISSIAALLLLTIAIPVYFNMAKESSLDAITIENYLSQQNVGTTELTQHLTDEDISSLENNLSLNRINSDALEDYLSESENLEYYINE